MEEHGSGDSGGSVAVSEDIEGCVEGVEVLTFERQRQLDGTVVVKVGE